MRRTCVFIKPSGTRCGAPPLKEGDRCFWHSAERSDDLAEAQKLGGKRRKREQAVGEAYAVDGIRDTDQAFRVLEIALVDTLALENGVPRNRTLVAIAQAALKAHETGELEQRVEQLEAAVQRHELPPPVFGVE